MPWAATLGLCVFAGKRGSLVVLSQSLKAFLALGESHYVGTCAMRGCVAVCLSGGVSAHGPAVHRGEPHCSSALNVLLIRHSYQQGNVVLLLPPKKNASRSCTSSACRRWSGLPTSAAAMFERHRLGLRSASASLFSLLSSARGQHTTSECCLLSHG